MSGLLLLTIDAIGVELVLRHHLNKIFPHILWLFLLLLGLLLLHLHRLLLALRSTLLYLVRHLGVAGPYRWFNVVSIVCSLLVTWPEIHTSSLLHLLGLVLVAV